jgi:hypothetical protein
MPDTARWLAFRYSSTSMGTPFLEVISMLCHIVNAVTRERLTRCLTAMA